MKSKRIYFTLNPKKEDDQLVLEYLQNAGCPYGKAIIIAVLDYLNRQKQDSECKELVQVVRDTIQDCFHSLSAYNSAQEAQAPTTEISDESVSPLDFIDAMTGGCSFA
jgi:hypothetical protein